MAQPDVNKIAEQYSGILKEIGADLDSEGMKETPLRAAKALVEMTEGSRMETDQLTKMFKAECQTAICHDMVIVEGIKEVGLCEHHLLPIIMNITIAYEGNGTFLKIATGAIITNIANSAGCAWGDYDNDGYLDLFVANLGQKNFLYHNNSDGSFTLIRDAGIGQEASYSWSGAWADFDNDGHLDLFVANGQPNGTGVKDFLYRNRGDGTFEKITLGSLVNDTSAGDGCAWGDYNNDGFLDLFVTNLNGQNNFLYRNSGNSNHWLTIQCEGRISNSSAIGTRLELTAEIAGVPVRQIREISAGSGYGSQNSLLVHFGVGQTTNILGLRIRWPSGIVQDLANLRVDERLILREPSKFRSNCRIEQGVFKAEFQGGPHSAYDVEVSEDFSNWTLLISFTNAGSPAKFEDVLTTPAGSRFYRVIEP